MNKDEVRGYLKAYCDQTDLLVKGGDLPQDDFGVRVIEMLRLYLDAEDAKKFLGEVVKDVDRFDENSFAHKLLSHIKLYFDFDTVHSFKFEPTHYNYNKEYTTAAGKVDLGSTFCGDWLEFYES